MVQYKNPEERAYKLLVLYVKRFRFEEAIEDDEANVGDPPSIEIHRGYYALQEFDFDLYEEWSKVYESLESYNDNTYSKVSFSNLFKSPLEEISAAVKQFRNKELKEQTTRLLAKFKYIQRFLIPSKKAIYEAKLDGERCW